MEKDLSPHEFIDTFVARDPRSHHSFQNEFTRRRKLLPRFTDHNPNTHGLSLAHLRPYTLCDAVVYGLYDKDAEHHIRYEVLLPENPREAGYLGEHEPIVQLMGLVNQRSDFELPGLFAEGTFGSLLLLDGFTSQSFPFLPQELQKTIQRYGIQLAIDASGTYFTLPSDSDNILCITPTGARQFGQALEQIKWNTLSQLMARELGIQTATDMLRFKSLSLLGLPDQQNEGYL